MVKIKFIKLLIALFLFYSNLKSQDIVMSAPDSGLKILTTSAKKIIVPTPLSSYAGIRFLDVRYLKEFIGFIPSLYDKAIYKLKTKNSFEEELNNANLVHNEDSVVKGNDSIIVVIKNFWFNRNQNEKGKIYCHVSALFFIKTSSEVYFDDKVDTFFNYKGPFVDFYKASIDKVINDLMLSYPKPGSGLTKKYLIDEFNANVQKKRVIPKNVIDSTGIFLSYKDFLNGNLYQIGIDINPFFDQFTFTIKDEALNVKLHKSIWGVMYKGTLYIRTENLLCKAFLAEGTYISRSNIEIRGAGSRTYSPVFNDDTNNSGTSAIIGFSSAAIINLLKKKKARIKSYPVVLNIETGELE